MTGCQGAGVGPRPLSPYELSYDLNMRSYDLS